MVFSKQEIQCLKDVMSAPTTSFHESEVRKRLERWMKQWDISWVSDRWGNLVLSNKPFSTTQSGATLSPKQIQKYFSESHFIFSAHMDHPGFVVISTNGRQALVKLYGAVHRGQFSGARVRAWDCSSETWIRGRVERHQKAGSPLEKDYRASLSLGLNQFHIQFDQNISVGSIGAFDQEGFIQQNKYVSSRAVDNVMNCAIALCTLREMKKAKNSRRVTVVFTRAEEEGFVGLYALARSGALAESTPWIILEASKAMGSVHLGEGVVVRVGDRASQFDPVVGHWLKTTAEKLSTKDKTFRYQRALLEGGTCEATLLNFLQVPTSCLALPLANYHNVGSRKPAPEKVHWDDVVALKKLLLALTSSPSPEDVFSESAAALSRRLAPLVAQLRSKKTSSRTVKRTSS